jgi:hypothetical protein
MVSIRQTEVVTLCLCPCCCCVVEHDLQRIKSSQIHCGEDLHPVDSARKEGVLQFDLMHCRGVADSRCVEVCMVKESQRVVVAVALVVVVVVMW